VNICFDNINNIYVLHTYTIYKLHLTVI